MKLVYLLAGVFIFNSCQLLRLEKREATAEPVEQFYFPSGDRKWGLYGFLDIENCYSFEINEEDSFRFVVDSLLFKGQRSGSKIHFELGDSLASYYIKGQFQIPTEYVLKPQKNKTGERSNSWIIERIPLRIGHWYYSRDGERSLCYYHSTEVSADSLAKDEHYINLVGKLEKTAILGLPVKFKWPKYHLQIVEGDSFNLKVDTFAFQGFLQADTLYFEFGEENQDGYIKGQFCISSKSYPAPNYRILDLAEDIKFDLGIPEPKNKFYWNPKESINYHTTYACQKEKWALRVGKWEYLEKGERIFIDYPALQ
ncbi:hypothetical protein SapgrDRAFT_3067 [Saprospira grandis DSM 2844]|uniref:Uncharacterized protein n=1 Tax=Saprospira grandis DSM 2844 TaxID=694433 RepID=J0XZS4_9BACT|nr:hypothetical protein [Saprospira grandis]EJF54716.1 hypothetical protein SapgrDRAFT_3067 [Saprospira grandis DSM 2844]